MMFNLLQAIFDTASSASSAVGNSSGKVWYLKANYEQIMTNHASISMLRLILKFSLSPLIIDDDRGEEPFDYFGSSLSTLVPSTRSLRFNGRCLVSTIF